MPVRRRALNTDSETPVRLYAVGLSYAGNDDRRGIHWCRGIDNALFERFSQRIEQKIGAVLARTGIVIAI